MEDGKRSCHAQKLVGGLHLSMFSCILISHPLILDSQLLIQPTDKLGVARFTTKDQPVISQCTQTADTATNTLLGDSSARRRLVYAKTPCPSSHQLTRSQSQPDSSSHDMTPSLSRWSAEPLALRISLTTEQYSTKRCFADGKSGMDGHASYGRAEESVKQGRTR